MTPVRVSRAEKVALIREARETRPDLTDRQRADLLGMTYSAYRNLWNDPDGSKQAARRAGYAGVCEACGAETKSDGTSRPSPRCGPCSKPEKVWTRERVVEAIQAWALEHGRPPTANDWVHSDPAGRWPNRGSVYRTRGSAPSVPFAAWADAIEAAGFPRPISGRWQNEERRATYIIDNPYALLGPIEVDLLAELERRGERHIRDLRHGSPYSTVRKALEALARRGLIVRVARGVYAPVQSEEAAA